MKSVWITKIYEDGGYHLYDTICTKNKPTKREINNYFNKYWPNGKGLTYERCHDIEEIILYTSFDTKA